MTHLCVNDTPVSDESWEDVAILALELLFHNCHLANRPTQPTQSPNQQSECHTQHNTCSRGRLVSSARNNRVLICSVDSIIHQSRAQIVDFFRIAISWQSPRQHHDIVTIAASAHDASSVFSHVSQHETRGWLGWPHRTHSGTGTVAQSDKSTTNTDSSHSHPSNDIVTQCHRRGGSPGRGGRAWNSARRQTAVSRHGCSSVVLQHLQ